MKEDVRHILFSGGGTLGPVMPLVAVLQELRVRHSAWEFLWVGTTEGPERAVVERLGVQFVALPPAKWRRYRSFKNITDCGVLLYDVFKSWRVINRFQPDLLVTAGGYVSVPLHLVAHCKRIKTLVHQEDVVPGLANRIMGRWATLVTTTFERSLGYFKTSKKIWIGNPVRARIEGVSTHEGRAYFGFSGTRKIILVVGGGTGAVPLNRLVGETLTVLGKHYDIIHITGRGKAYWIGSQEAHHPAIAEHYKQFEFLNEADMARALAAADVVVTRGGLSTLSELAVLGKPALIVPIKGSHQEHNAEVFVGRGAAVLFDETGTSEEFARAVKTLLDDERELVLMAHNMKKIMPANAREALAVAIETLVL